MVKANRGVDLQDEGGISGGKGAMKEDESLC